MDVGVAGSLGVGLQRRDVVYGRDVLNTGVDTVPAKTVTAIWTLRNTTHSR